MRGLCSLGLGMAPGKRRTPGPRLARRAHKTAERRTAGLGREPGQWVDEAREYDPVQRMAALVEAAEKKDWENFKVRRPLEAGSSCECAPSWGVCLGLGQWTLDAVVARPIRPCGVESSPYVRQQSGNCNAACRCSSVPVRTSRSVARTLPCRLAESPDFSPPPSPAIAVSATF